MNSSGNHSHKSTLLGYNKMVIKHGKRLEIFGTCTSMASEVSKFVT